MRHAGSKIKLPRVLPAVAMPTMVPKFTNGSNSLAQLMALHRQPQRAVLVEPHHPYELGPFVVRFIPSVHSKLLLGWSGDPTRTVIQQTRRQPRRRIKGAVK